MKPRVVAKARGDRARIEELIARESARVRRAFRQFLDDVTGGAVRRAVRRALEDGGVEAALDIIDAYVARLGGVLAAVFQQAGASEARSLSASLRRAHLALSFDPTLPRAAEIMRRSRLEFVVNFSAAQRAATRSALVEALRSGAGPVKAAHAFRDSIGLTQSQLAAVANYRALLERGDAAALDREIRDRRFDPSVRRAAGSGEPLGADKIQRMVEQYRRRYVQYRAETIARTETLRTVGLARDEALDQVLDQSGIDAARVVRVWRSTRDSRTRDTHLAMDGQPRGAKQPFQSPSGALLMYPGDPAAPAAEIINCRCVVVHQFRD